MTSLYIRQKTLKEFFLNEIEHLNVLVSLTAIVASMDIADTFLIANRIMFTVLVTLEMTYFIINL